MLNKKAKPVIKTKKSNKREDAEDLDLEDLADEGEERSHKQEKVISNKKESLQQEEKVLLTKEGLQNLKEELSLLKNSKRKEVAKRLQEAISYGDLSENAEYEEAKNEQAFCEGRIAELEKMIKNAELIDESKSHKAQKVRIGTTMVIKNITKDKEEEKMEFTIVGSTEADPFASRISNESPIGKNLIGKQKGDIVKFNAPGGVFEFELLEIK